MSCFVLQHLQKVRCDFSKIKPQFAQQIFILITSDNFNEAEYAAWHEVFDQVVIVENLLDIEATKAKIDTYTHIEDGQEPLAFVSNDEYCLTLKAQLQQHYLHHVKDDHAAYSLLTDKCAMKARVARAGVAVPKFLRFQPAEYRADPDAYLQKIEITLRFPLIAKPTNQANNRDVTLVHNQQQLSAVLQVHQDDVNFELECFIQGKLFHCNTLISNDEYQLLMVAEYANPCLKFAQGEPIGSIVLPPISDTAKRIAAFNTKVLAALGAIPNGITHLEVFERVNGELVFLEIAARAPGAIVPDMSEIYLGVNIEQLNFEAQLGKRRELKPDTEGEYACWLWYPAPTHTVYSITAPKVDSQINVNAAIKLGFTLSETAIDPTLAVEILAKNPSYLDLYRDFKTMRRFNPFVEADAESIA